MAKLIIDLAKEKQKEHERLQHIDETIRPILKKYYSPTEEEITNIRNMVDEHTQNILHHIPPDHFKRSYYAYHNSHIEEKKEYRKIANSLEHFLTNRARVVREDLINELSTKNLTNDQFNTALEALFNVAKLPIDEELSFPNGRQQEATSNFTWKMDDILPAQLNRNKRSIVIAEIINKLTDLDVTNNNITQKLRNRRQ